MNKEINILVKATKHNWKLPKDVFGHYKKDYYIKEKYEDFLNKLDNCWIDYLNELGYTVNFDGTAVGKATAQYMFANTGYYLPDSKEPLCAWMHRKQGGNFGDILMGTRKMFEKEILLKRNNSSSL